MCSQFSQCCGCKSVQVYICSFVSSKTVLYLWDMSLNIFENKEWKAWWHIPVIAGAKLSFCLLNSAMEELTNILLNFCWLRWLFLCEIVLEKEKKRYFWWCSKTMTWHCGHVHVVKKKALTHLFFLKFTAFPLHQDPLPSGSLSSGINLCYPLRYHNNTRPIVQH